MDKYLDIELDSYGFMISGAQGYLSLSWLGIGLLTLSVVGYRIIKKVRDRK